MRNLKQLSLATITVALACSITPLSANAQEYTSLPTNNPPVIINSGSQTSNATHELTPTPPISGGGSFSTNGMNPPNSDSSSHNLSVSPYNYQVHQVGAQIYTDKILYGKTSMKVLVSNYEIISGTGPKSNLYVYLYKANGTFVDKYSLGSGYTSSYTFTGLDKNTKYFVGWSVTNAGNNKYAFDGTIS